MPARFLLPAACLLLSALPAAVPAQDTPAVPPAGAAAAAVPAVQGIGLAGGTGTYRVLPGDNLTLVAARLGAFLPQLWADNALDGRAFLRVGQALAYDNRHVVPPAPVATGGSLLLNIPQRMLFLYADGQLQAAWPAAAGRHDWPTPETDTRIANRLRDKEWVVPPSIQAEMAAQGKPVLARVPPGPENPLGAHWLGLELPGYGIHGTNAPASVYGARTHGCVRLQPEHVAELYERAAVGMPVRFTYAPVLLFAPPDGPVWLEAHPDAYARGLDYAGLARALADAAGVTERIDWAVAESVLTGKQGIARDVSRQP